MKWVVLFIGGFSAGHLGSAVFPNDLSSAAALGFVITAALVLIVGLDK